eukprot:gene20402-24436_t
MTWAGRESHLFIAFTFIQALSFHDSHPVPSVDAMFLSFFKAEVHSTLLNKAKYIASKRFACLVVRDSLQNVERPIGVVETSIQGEASVIKYMGTDEYLYVCCMAVLPEFRRRGVALDLLTAADVMAKQWGFRKLALHVYEHNTNARKLYTRAGYEEVEKAPAWVKYFGQPRRILMVKSIASSSA